MTADIRLFGARQNNLKNLNLTIPAGQLLVLTGVSGSGKSSLAFDTIYAEGQRRYVETFSPYARQFLDRMDKPQVDRIEGILPAIAIDQVNPVRNSRSTVGTMTELNDHLKLLFARMAQLYCQNCAQPIQRHTSQSVAETLAARTAAQDPRLIITFPVTVPDNFDETEVESYLSQQGYTRIHHRESPGTLYVIQDRFRYQRADHARIMEALDTAFEHGRGEITVFVQANATTEETRWQFSQHLRCADCNIHYQRPLPSTFSFNSPLGACETCRGFGRVMGIDYGLVIPDPRKSLKDGALRPLQTPTYRPHQEEMERHAKEEGIRIDVPWEALSQKERDWVIEGTPKWTGRRQSWKTQWYGMQRFFNWLENRAYRMHVRVLLSKYRSYTPCPDCQASRLKPEANLWRVGQEAVAVAPNHPRFRPTNASYSDDTLHQLPGLNITDMMRLPIGHLQQFFATLSFGERLDKALTLLLEEIRTRINYLCEVGLHYLSLDRQSRTLSGGEVQRINLTTALGTSLVNTLFVLDEPSIGLHPRDMHRIVAIMQRLSRQGNTLLVVEHDPQVMVAADRILDMGPGPGKHGGEIVFDGSPNALKNSNTLTGRYLRGDLAVEAPRPQAVKPNTPKLLLEGVSAHNLKNISVSIPLQRLVCLTGVSGSGKSTLIQDVLYPAFLKQRGQPTEAPGSFKQLLGTEQLADMILVDQSPIGKSARSNPASYVKAYDAIRRLFADTELAQARGYKPGTFSFNSGTGRCPGCGGTGFEHIEMQFLSDVYLRCPDCDGKRFRQEILDVKVTHNGQSASIADVLAMTVGEASEFFTGLQAIQRGLAPLRDVGLEYLQLGQPVPTLSGGEAQRLKLAGHLAAAMRRGISTAKVAKKGSLLLFDEPTTGLHFEDIAKLMQAFRKLLEAGHSLLIIEHNLDVIRAADWLIDLGPEGGDEGGHIVTQGTPQEVMRCAHSYTGQALQEYEAQRQQLPAGVADSVTELRPDFLEDAHDSIQIVNAREHNLNHVTVDIPHGQFNVVTGVSGSGKSTLAFDILFNEGQRRYLESINAYARSIVQPASQPDVDAIYGIAPTVAIEQRTSRGGYKSTVATMTEIHHFLRLLYVRLGTQMCPDCEVAVAPQHPEQIVAQLISQENNTTITLLAPLVVARKGLYTDLARWAENKGYHELRVDGEFLAVNPWPRLDRYKEHTIELPVAQVAITPAQEDTLRQALHTALAHGKGNVNVLIHDNNGAIHQQQQFSINRACPSCHRSFPEPDPRMFSYNSKHGWCPKCFGTGATLKGFDAKQTGEESQWLSEDDTETTTPCPHCAGARLNPVSLAVRWHDHSIAEVGQLSINDAITLFDQLKLSGREADIAQDVIAEIASRLQFLRRVGLGYLALDRAAPTLSGGEAQRIRLAAQLGSNLQGVCYVLDEPTIGLHSRDNHVLLDALQALGEQGNTLVVVEHDEDTIRRADHIIDMGPGAGTQGGNIVAQGSLKDIMACPESLTGYYFKHPLEHPLQPTRAVTKKTPAITLHKAYRHNLKKQDATIPLNRLTVITGVSGSGKSTLARDVLLTNLRQALAAQREKQKVSWIGCEAITGWDAIERVLEVDQTPIGKTPRSCAATYIGFWDDVRRLFASTREAKLRGWTATRFSFNTGDGRCPVCQGQGLRTLEMNFLPDVKVLCDGCDGARFNADTLQVLWNGKHIGDVLNMRVDDAIDYFSAHRKILRPLQLMQDVGLGYLTLGQPSPTLSGGEAQRIKLVFELVKARIDEGVHRTGRASRLPHTLYVLDEPTVGLSTADVEKLIRVLHRLVDAEHTVVVIEHHLDIIAEADWIVDLGPEGGDDGGSIVVQGSPNQVTQAHQHSHTGAALRAFLSKH